MNPANDAYKKKGTPKFSMGKSNEVTSCDWDNAYLKIHLGIKRMVEVARKLLMLPLQQEKSGVLTNQEAKSQFQWSPLKRRR